MKNAKARGLVSTAKAVSIAMLVSIFSPGAFAAPVKFSFSGTIFDVFSSVGTPAEFALGDSFSGSYIFDSSAVDANANPAEGFYFNSVAAFEIVAGSYSGSAANGNILVRNNIPTADEYNVSSHAESGLDVMGLGLSAFGFYLIDTSGSALNSDALLLTPPDPGAFNIVTGYLDFSDGSEDIMVTADIESITLSPIPVPAAAWLFASALLGLAGFGRRRKAKTCS